VLQLPLDERTTLLDHWAEHYRIARAGVLEPGCGLRVVLNDRLAPDLVARYGSRGVCLEQEAEQYRGTGGVLRDLCESYADGDYILFGAGLSLPSIPLQEQARGLASVGGDVVVGVDPDRASTGFMLIRCGVLRQIPPVGFNDFKEQALPRIAKQFEVRIKRWDRPAARPLRTLRSYLEAVAAFHRARLDPADRRALSHDLAWNEFGIVEPDADVHPTARLHNAVVLAGGRVEAGAMVIRAVIGPGTVVGRGQRLIDRVQTRAKRPNLPARHTTPDPAPPLPVAMTRGWRPLLRF
jgi:hypothetical protein